MFGVKELPLEVESHRDGAVRAGSKTELFDHTAQLQGGLILVVFAKHHIFHAENGVTLTT